LGSNHIKRIDFTKSVRYDDKEDVYYVKSVTIGEKYKINKLKNNIQKKWRPPFACFPSIENHEKEFYLLIFTTLKIL
jgi:hypothetical protein